MQAELIELPGAKSLYNHWNNEEFRNSSRVETEVASEIATNLVIPNSNASIGVSMLLGNNMYDLRSFEIEFEQEIDHKGEPQSGVRGGVATVGLYSLPDVEMNKWVRNNEELDGRFLFGDKLMGYSLTMEFKRACCMGYFVEIRNFSEDSFAACLNIAPKIINFGKGISFKVPYCD